MNLNVVQLRTNRSFYPEQQKKKWVAIYVILYDWTLDWTFDPVVLLLLKWVKSNFSDINPYGKLFRANSAV